ncbi:MAG: hypothetical protein ACTHNN_04765 [Xanthobacteraceae bacterium]
MLVAGAILATIPLSGCSMSVADLPIVGVPEGAPKRPANPGAFPAVHDMPAPREQTALDPAEQARIESELAAARDHQAAAAAAANAPSAPAGKK